MARRRRLSASWSPADLGANLKGWWDFSDFSRLYQDSGRTTLVTATGQTVASVTDRSGNGLHLTQPTASKEPAVVTVGSLYGLSFDGADDWLYANSSVSLGDYTVVMRVKFDYANGYCWFLSATNYHYAYRPSGYTYYINRGGTPRNYDSAAAWASLGTQANYAWVCASSSPYGQMDRNNAAQGTITASAGTSTQNMTFCLLSDNAGAYRAQATACEVLLIDRALNASELTQAHDYLTAKWV